MFEIFLYDSLVVASIITVEGELSRGHRPLKESCFEFFHIYIKSPLPDFSFEM
jgi:hypothetical protein